jgi:hypothetical protein
MQVYLKSTKILDFVLIHMTIDNKVFVIAWAIAQVWHIGVCDDKCKIIVAHNK